MQFLSHGLCRHAVLLLSAIFRWNQKISWWVMAKKIFKMVTWLQHLLYVPNFIKLGRFFTDIWRFNDFQNGGCLPSWILNICRFCHLALVDMPFCFLIRNFAEIGQSVDELWPKKRFSRWQPPPSWILKFQFLVTWSETIVYCRRLNSSKSS